MKTALVLPTRIVRVLERHQTVGDVRDAEGKATTQQVSDGWWIVLDNHVSICVGVNKLDDIAVGDLVALVVRPRKR